MQIKNLVSKINKLPAEAYATKEYLQLSKKEEKTKEDKSYLNFLHDDSEVFILARKNSFSDLEIEGEEGKFIFKQGDYLYSPLWENSSYLFMSKEQFEKVYEKLGD